MASDLEEEKPQPNGSASSSSFGGKISNFISNRRKILMATSVTAVLISIVFAAFMALLPLKLEHFMKNFAKKFGAKVEDKIETRLERHAVLYLAHRALGSRYGECQGPSKRYCERVFKKGTVIGDLHRSWKSQKFEDKLAKDHGVRFLFDKNTKRVVVITPNVKNGRFELDIDDDGNIRNMQAFDNHREARNFMNDKIRQSTKWNQYWKRRHMRDLLRTKYGVRNWRPFVVEKARDKVSDKANEARVKFKTYMVDNVTKPALSRMGLYLSCIMEGCKKSDLEKDVDPHGIDERNAAAADLERQSSCASNAAGAKPAGCEDKGFKDEDNVGGDGQPSTERDQARAEARAALANIAFANEDIDGLDTTQTPEIVRETAQKFAIKKVAASLLAGIGIAEVLVQIHDAIAKDYISDITEDRNKLQYARMFSGYQSAIDQFKFGDITSGQVGALMESLDKMEGSRVYEQDFDQPQSKKALVCDGKEMTQGEVLCPDKVVSKPSGSTEFYRGLPFFPILDAVASAYKSTIGGFIRFAGNLLSDLASPIMKAASSLIPGAVKEKVEALLNTTLNFFFGIVITGAEVGEELYNAIRAGAEVVYNDVAHYTIGGMIVSNAQQSALNSQYAQKERERYSSFGDRIANLDYSESLASKLITAMPFTPETAVENTAMAIINPIKTMGSIPIFSRAKAANKNPFHIKNYDYPDTPQAQRLLKLPADHEFWQHCDAFNDEWTKQVSENPDKNPTVTAFDGEKVVGINPCRLEFVAAESGKSNFTDKDDGGIGAGVGQEDDLCSPATGDDNSVASGTASQLADQILKHPNIELASNPKGSFEELKREGKTSTAYSGHPTTNVNEGLLSTLIHIANKHKIRISSLTTGGHSTGKGGHYYGNAVDIDKIEGQLTNGSDAGAQKLVNAAVEILPKGSAFGLGENPAAIKLPNGFGSFSDNPDHVHIQIKVGSSVTTNLEQASCNADGDDPSATAGAVGSIAGVEKYSDWWKGKFNYPSDFQKNIKPTGIIIHWWGATGNDVGGITSGWLGTGNVGHFDPFEHVTTSNNYHLASQFAITESGKAFQLTPNANSFARHATCANTWAIGIEISGGVGGASLPTSGRKFNATVDLVTKLMKEFDIPAEGSIGAKGWTGKGIHSHKEQDPTCQDKNGKSIGSGKQDVNESFMNALRNKVRN